MSLNNFERSISRRIYLLAKVGRDEKVKQLEKKIKLIEDDLYSSCDSFLLHCEVKDCPNTIIVPEDDIFEVATGNKWIVCEDDTEGTCLNFCPSHTDQSMEYYNENSPLCKECQN